MKTNLTKLWLTFICVFCSSLQAAEHERSFTDDDRKVINFFRQHGHYTDHPGYPEGHQYWKDLMWFHNAGDKVIPGLIYLLENEYKGQWDKMRDVISTLGNRHRKDRSDLLRHIRKNLPNLVDKVNNRNEGYVYTSLRCLSQHGDASDIPLMERFAEIGGEIEKLHTRQDIKKLKNRLAKEKEIFESPDNRSKKPRPADNKSSSLASEETSSKPASTSAVGATSLWSKWPIMLAVGFVLSGLFIWLKAKSRA